MFDDPTRTEGEGENPVPPPVRKKKEARPNMSVYPPRRVGVTLGGFRSSPFTQAIMCWAKLLENATVEMADGLSVAEWQYLAVATSGREHDFQVDNDDPGELLAQRVEHAATYEIGSETLSRQKARALADKVRALDYLHSWAVIWAIQWRADFLHSGAEIRADEQWWTLAHRRRHLGEQE